MKYIDIHSHLNTKDFDTDREAVLARMQETETGTIIIGTDLESSKRAVELADKAGVPIWACIGVHPVDDPAKIFDVDAFEALARHPKVVAIGECGLDYFRIEKTEEEVARQEKLFLDQIDFAIAHDLPLMIHQRDAIPEVLLILEASVREYGPKLRGDIHFFSGDLAQAERFWNMGFTTSFTGVITFARNYDEVIKNAPLEMLMSETDAPWIAPVPYRGKRNEPSYVTEVVKKIAEIRGENVEIVEKAMISNAKRMFRIA
ncbi:MAG: TatD DNase family protein [Parcubacteria group bacterium]|nr:TatD DNase family protein [Parcubacteria group bacterium]